MQTDDDTLYYERCAGIDVPNREQRELRDMTRFRKSQIEERSRNINRLQKFLEGANIKLKRSNVNMK